MFQYYVVVFLLCIAIVQGLYIKASNEQANKVKPRSVANNEVVDDEWSIFQEKLGLTNQKIDLLKSQKDQKATIDLVNRFIEENPKYTTKPPAAHKPLKDSNNFNNVYNAIVKNLKLSKSMLKASLNFELTDNNNKPISHLKRSRRRIAVKMVSDMPAEQIDDLLDMFNKQNGINHKDDSGQDEVKDDDDSAAAAAGAAAPSLNFHEVENLPSAMDPDYMYENLYEDEEDLAMPARTRHNSDYGSFQDLIMSAKRHQWKQEMEETKLHRPKNQHYI